MTITDEAKRNQDAMLAIERRKENLERGWPADVADASATEATEAPLVGRTRWIADSAWKPRNDRGLVRAAAAATHAVSANSEAAGSDDAAGAAEPIGRDAWIARNQWKGGAR